MSIEEKARCANCGGSGRVSAESELFAGVMGTTGCKACEGTGWILSPLPSMVRWLRALEVRLGRIIESESGEMKKHFEHRRGVYEGIADDIERLWKLTPKDDKDKDRLIELYALAEQHMPKKPKPERAAEIRKRILSTDPVTALENVIKGLEPHYDPDRVSAVSQLWDRWDRETDIHQKTLLQLELGACVSSLLENIEALEKELPEPNPFRDEEGKPWV